MPILRDLADLFESIFMSSNPEVKKRQALKKMEADLRTYRPLVFSSGLVQVNLAEAFRILYVNTKPIDDILSNTICSDDMTRNNKFQEQLLLTGFDDESQEILERMDYDVRKKGAMEAVSLNRYFEAEHRDLEKVIKSMNTPEFMKIDSVIDRLKQLFDICRYGYVSTLRLFDVNFSTTPGYKPQFQPIAPDLLENAMLDVYYVMADFDISMSVGQAVIALAELLKGSDLEDSDKKSIMDNLRKIQSVRKQIFTNDFMEKLICLSKKNPDFVPVKAAYRSNARQTYAQFLEDKFIVDEGRLKTEIQDETIAIEVQSLFGSSGMAAVEGYNDEVNSMLKQSTPVSFEYVTPYRILKTFVMLYYEEHVKPLLNDIVIEGFFNNPAYKTEFTNVIYSINETMERIILFEKMFERGAPFDEALIVSLIRDSHKDNDFVNKLKELVDKINKTAKELIQGEVTTIHHLDKLIGEIIADSKKPAADSIGNLKMLMMSTRNRDNSEYLERQHSSWAVFLEIMKNYVIIGNIEKK